MPNPMEGKRMDLKVMKDSELVRREANRLKGIIDGHVALGKPETPPDTMPRPLTTVAALERAEKETKELERKELSPSATGTANLSPVEKKLVKIFGGKRGLLAARRDAVDLAEKDGETVND